MLTKYEHAMPRLPPRRKKITPDRVDEPWVAINDTFILRLSVETPIVGDDNLVSHFKPKEASKPQHTIIGIKI
jgi:hypothetical protein